MDADASNDKSLLAGPAPGGARAIARIIADGVSSPSTSILGLLLAGRSFERYERGLGSRELDIIARHAEAQNPLPIPPRVCGTAIQGDYEAEP